MGHWETGVGKSKVGCDCWHSLDETHQQIFSTHTSVVWRSPLQLLMSRKLRTKLPTSKHPLESKHRPAAPFHQDEPVRVREGHEWMPAEVVKQHKAPRSYILATADESRLCPNFVPRPTEETTSVTSPAIETFSVGSCTFPLLKSEDARSNC